MPCEWSTTVANGLGDTSDKRAMNETQSHAMGIVWKCLWDRHLRTIERMSRRVEMGDSWLLGERERQAPWDVSRYGNHGL